MNLKPLLIGILILLSSASNIFSMVLMPTMTTNEFGVRSTNYCPVVAYRKTENAIKNLSLYDKTSFLLWQAKMEIADYFLLAEQDPIWGMTLGLLSLSVILAIIFFSCFTIKWLRKEIRL